MPASIFGNPAAVVQLNQALFGIAPGNGKYTNQLAQANSVGSVAFARQLGQTVATSDDALATAVLANVGINNPTLKDALVQAFAAFPNDRGVVVLNLTNILTTLEGNAVYGAAAAQFNAQVATDFQYSTNPVNTQDSPVNAGTATLTANTDILTGNVFEAGLVFTPGGDDRINSLQDEDRLTGTGTNATLNATLGNANDNGGTSIAPVLTGVQTVNATFTGSNANGANGAVTTLDLQDATGLTTVNIQRISNGLGGTPITIANLASEATNSIGISNVSVKANVNIDYQDGVLLANTPAQEASVRLTNVQIDNLRIHNRAGVVNDNGTEGFERITINNTGTNQLDDIFAAQLRALTLTGAGSFSLNEFDANAIDGGVTTVGTTTQVGAGEFQRFDPVAITNVNAPLESINGTAATGALSIDISGFTGAQADPVNSGRTVFLNVQGGTAADKFFTNTAIADATVVINGNGGNDTLVAYNSVLDTNPLNATNPDIQSIENLEVRAQQNAAINIDLSEIGGLVNTLLRNETAAAAPVVFSLFEATQDQANNVSINHGATRGNGINVPTGDGTTVRVNLNDASGANDSATLRLITDQNNNVRFNVAFDVDGNQVADQFATAGFGNNNTRTGAPVLDANNQPINARVENITINDTDAESNAIELTRAQSVAAAGNAGENADNHRGTITVTGGQAGQFLNLDATANAYRWDQSGAAVDGGTGSPTVTAINGRATNGSRSDVGGGTAERLVAGVFDSSTYAGDLVIRVSDNLAAGSLGGQRITFGAGNDTVIFDQVNTTALNRNTAGLTISDTVAGGAGTDILALDGHNFAVTITASEWTNVSGFEVIRTVGNAVVSNNARGATNAYNLTLTNDLLATNGATDGGVKRIIIVNDNDATNDQANVGNDNAVGANGATNNGQGANGNIAAATGVETGITINAITLNANNSFEYRGEEGNSNTADRFILADANINGAAIIDGGAASNITTVTNVVRDFDSMRNNDVLEVRNASTVSAGDLANISDVGTLEFTNDTSVAQNSILVIDDAIVDRMVDAYQTSRVDNLGLQTVILQNQERLVVKAIDNVINNGGMPQDRVFATTGLTVQADSLTGRSAVDAFLGRGTHSIVTGGGNDRVVLLGNYGNVPAYGVDTGETINNFANGQGGAFDFRGTINLGGQTGQGANGGVDVLAYYGITSFVNATLAGIEFIDPNSGMVILASQLAALTGVRFTGGLGHQMVIVDDLVGVNNAIDLSKIILNGGSLQYNVVLANGNNAVAGVDYNFTGAVVDNSVAGNAAINGALNQTTVNGLGAVIAPPVITTVNAANSPFASNGTQSLLADQGGADSALVVNLSNSVAADVTYTGFNANDTLAVTQGLNLINVNAGATTTFGRLDLSVGGPQLVSMTTAQHNGFGSVVVSETGDTLQVQTAGTLTGFNTVGTYNITEGSTFTVGALSQTVNESVGAAANSTVIFGAGVYTGNFNQFELADTFRVVNGTNLSATNLGTGTYDFQNAAVTVTFDQSIVNQPTNVYQNTTGAQTINVSDLATFSAVTGIENYVLQTNGSTIAVVAATNVTVAGNGGADTINVGGLTVTGIYTADNQDRISSSGANISGASITNAQNLTLNGGITLSAAQYSALTTNAVVAGGGTDSVTFTNAIAGANDTNAQQVETFNFAAGTNTFTFSGASAKTAVGNTGADTFNFTALTNSFNHTVSLGTDAVTDRVSLGNAAIDPANVNLVTVNNFTVANDAIASLLAGASLTAGGFAAVVNGSNTDLGAGAANRAIEITNTNVLNLAAVAENVAIENVLISSIGTLTNGSYTAVIYSGADAGVYQFTFADAGAAGVDAAAELVVEHVATLVGVGLNAVDAVNFF